MVHHRNIERRGLAPDSLRCYARVPRTRSLGPFSRYAFWVQGCPLGCKGCMTPDSQPFDGGTVLEVDSLVQEILGVDDIEGITISGGEPFAQAAALAALMEGIRRRRDLGLILYSGYRLAALHKVARREGGVQRLLAQIDLLIDGRYVESENDGARLNGSANQCVIPLTGRYLQNLDHYDSSLARSVEVHVDVDLRMLVGIPSARQLQWWESWKSKSLGKVSSLDEPGK